MKAPSIKCSGFRGFICRGWKGGRRRNKSEMKAETGTAQESRNFPFNFRDPFDPQLLPPSFLSFFFFLPFPPFCLLPRRPDFSLPPPLIKATRCRRPPKGKLFAERRKGFAGGGRGGGPRVFYIPPPQTTLSRCSPPSPLNLAL